MYSISVSCTGKILDGKMSTRAFRKVSAMTSVSVHLSSHGNVICTIKIHEVELLRDDQAVRTNHSWIRLVSSQKGGFSPLLPYFILSSTL